MLNGDVGPQRWAALMACIGIWLTPSTSNAQQQERPRVGLYAKGGIDAAQLAIANDGTESRGATRGFIGGLVVMMPANRKLAFQLELLLNDGHPIVAAATEKERTVGLLAVPLLIRSNLARTASSRLGILGGVVPVSQLQRRADVTQEFTDIVMTIGMDYETRRGVLLDLRYTRGIVDAAAEPGIRNASRTRGIVATAGWRLY